MKYKQQQKQKSERDINRLSIQLKSKLDIMIICVLLHKVKLAVKSAYSCKNTQSEINTEIELYIKTLLETYPIFQNIVLTEQKQS